MAERDFFEATAKARAAEAIKKVEAQTAAEVVIAVRKSSSSYRAVDLGVGAAFAMASLATMIYSPRPFAASTMPLDVLLAFGLGVLCSAMIGPIKRAFVGNKARGAAVDREAKAAFYDLGIAKTRRRAGILVFASIFEGRAKLVPDAGVDLTALAGKLEAVEASMSDRVRKRDFAGFMAVVESLGDVLKDAHPRTEGLENELPDEMQ